MWFLYAKANQVTTKKVQQGTLKMPPRNPKQFCKETKKSPKNQKLYRI